MAKVGFTRDEVILALDVLYSSDSGRVNAASSEILQLSRLLNRLPIHPLEVRDVEFRTPTGITAQIMRFRSSCLSGKNTQNIGSLFFEIAFEFEDKRDELHSIAQAIRRNEAVFTAPFGAVFEDEGFAEGVLLGHLHRIIERRDGAKLPLLAQCEVCCIRPAISYRNAGRILTNHLLVDPTEMDYSKKYRADSFVTVCPTCHAALHHYRPWLGKGNCGDILR